MSHVSAANVATTIKYATVIDSLLPSPVATFVNYTCKVHRFWKGFVQTKEIVESANNFGLATVGWTLNCLCGDRSIITIPARCVLIARRVIECIDAQHGLVQNYTMLKNACTRKASYEPKRYLSFNTCSFLSPSVKVSTTLCCNQVIERIRNIFSNLTLFFSSLFVLSMSYMDLLTSFSPSDEARTESVQNSCLNCNFVLKKLDQYKDEVHATLFSLGAKYEIKPITTATSWSLKVASLIYDNGRFFFNKVVEEACSLTHWIVRPTKQRISSKTKGKV